MAHTINGVVVEDAAWPVRKNMLIVIDPADIRKADARRVPYLATERDGSGAELVPG